MEGVVGLNYLLLLIVNIIINTDMHQTIAKYSENFIAS